jgi:hypothetical protein
LACSFDQKIDLGRHKFFETLPDLPQLPSRSALSSALQQILLLNLGDGFRPIRIVPRNSFCDDERFGVQKPSGCEGEGELCFGHSDGHEFGGLLK